MWVEWIGLICSNKKEMCENKSYKSSLSNRKQNTWLFLERKRRTRYMWQMLVTFLATHTFYAAPGGSQKVRNYKAEHSKGWAKNGARWLSHQNVWRSGTIFQWTCSMSKWKRKFSLLISKFAVKPWVYSKPNSRSGDPCVMKLKGTSFWHMQQKGRRCFHLKSDIVILSFFLVVLEIQVLTCRKM